MQYHDGGRIPDCGLDVERDAVDRLVTWAV